MACYQTKNLPDNFSATGRPVYRTEADCLKSCGEAACCEADGSCNIKQQCECDTENGAVFAAGGACEACSESFRTQPRYTKIAAVDVTITSASNPLP